MVNKAIFLDRDGVINKRLIGDYVKRIEEFELLPKVREALIEFKKMGYLLIVVTNQQGIAKGVMTEEDLKVIHDYMLKLLPEIDDIFYCPHLEGTCNCRKPRNGMLLKAKEKWNIDFSRSWMIGDSESDIICGKSVGCKTIRILYDNDKTEADFIAKSLYDCVEIIKREDFKILEIYKEIELSEEELSSAYLLFENKKYRDAISRAYYSMFHSARALLLSKNINPKKHSGVIGKFGEVAIRGNLIDRKYGKYLSKAFELRTLSDYDVFYSPKNEDVEEIIEYAEEFLNTIKKLLKR